ncbi:MAG: DnaJ domain-containing protein [Nanoarchaeota archaeon]|nr:DnaJ domain-containing protein [Nanoarchaeota archaeon]
MATIKVRAEEFNVSFAKDSFSRRAIQCRSKILLSLKKLGVKEESTDIPIESVAIKKAPASAAWFFEGKHLFFSFTGAGRFVDNLYTVQAVIDSKVEDLINEKLPFEEFMAYFAEEPDIKDARKAARETLGLHEDTTDLSVINKRYKELAKEHHPDTPNGDADKFKEINNAHKTLKRELE